MKVMGKIHANITLDPNLVEKVKKKQLNMSDIAEKALIKELETAEKNINHNIETCEFCGRKDVKATKDNLTGLCWLYPDEKWICDRCLTHKKRRLAYN